MADNPIGVAVDDEADSYMEEDELTFTTETLEALKEAERIARDPNTKRYTDIDELMKDSACRLVNR